MFFFSLFFFADTIIAILLTCTCIRVLMLIPIQCNFLIFIGSSVHGRLLLLVGISPIGSKMS